MKQNMKILRLKQVSLRNALKEREELNKALRAKITPIWEDKSKDAEVSSLAKELNNGRNIVKAQQLALKNVKKCLRLTNQVYDNCLSIEM
jgi:hypothetical protein